MICRTAWMLIGALALASSQGYAGHNRHKQVDIPKTPPETALRSYVDRVRAQQAAEVRTPGSIWSPNGQLVRLGTDVKAFRIHDVVSVVVTESLAASTDGQVKNSRSSNASSKLSAVSGALDPGTPTKALVE